VFIKIIPGLATAIITDLPPLNIIFELVNIGTMRLFVLVAVTVLVLRKTEREAQRPFRTPLGPVVPVLCMLFCFALKLVLPHVTILRFIVWLLIGFVIYNIDGQQHTILGSSPVAGGGKRVMNRKNHLPVRYFLQTG